MHCRDSAQVVRLAQLHEIRRRCRCRHSGLQNQRRRQEVKEAKQAYHVARRYSLASVGINTGTLESKVQECGDLEVKESS